MGSCHCGKNAAGGEGGASALTEQGKKILVRFKGTCTCVGCHMHLPASNSTGNVFFFFFMEIQSVACGSGVL